MRRLRRPPGTREVRAQIAGNAAWLDSMIPGGLPADLAASAELVMPAEPKPRQGQVNRQLLTAASATDIDAVHRNRGETLHRPLEADVIRAVEALLKVHPRVLWALRMNSGAASYEAASGKFAPVWFHRWIRAPEKCRMSDFYGAVAGSPYAGYNWPHPCILAIECKRPGWSKPTDQREREQAAFLEIVRCNGGIGLFATSAEDVARALA